jgi:hypothetical protein
MIPDMRQVVYPDNVWEAIYIIDGLLKNKSELQPDTVHADIRWNQNRPSMCHLA